MAAVAAAGDTWVPVIGAGALARTTGAVVGAGSFRFVGTGSALLVAQLPTGAVADVADGSPVAAVVPVTVEESSSPVDLGSGLSKIIDSRGDSYSLSVGH